MSLAKKYLNIAESSESNSSLLIQPKMNRRVLIVDDEKSVAESLQSVLLSVGEHSQPIKPRSSRQLQSSSDANAAHLPAKNSESEIPFDITVVHTPQEALQKIRQSVQESKPYAMGFFDVMLNADIDGIELVKQALAIDPEIYAVFVTAYHDRSVHSIQSYLGAEQTDRWDYLNKPFSEGEIIQKARHLTSLWYLKRLKNYQNEQIQEIQRRLLQNERTATVAAIGRGVAHEFGNLLMQIVGNADLALIKNEPERMRQALETILTASETAGHVLSRFKNLAQGIESNEDVADVKLQLIDILQPINEALDLMNFQFRKNHINVVKANLESVLLEANKYSLVQVLMNVFINALHVMPKGGDIKLSLSKISPEIISLQIHDSGPGIEESLLAKVREPLFTTKGEGGSGLGLEIVEIEHQGKMKLSNHPQGGLLVEILLPIRQEHADKLC